MKTIYKTLFIATTFISSLALISWLLHLIIDDIVIITVVSSLFSFILTNKSYEIKKESLIQ